MSATTVVVIWLLVASRVPALVRRRHDSVFYVALTAAIAVTLYFPPVAFALESATGYADLGSLLSGCVMMLAFGLFRSSIIRAVVSPEEQAKALHRGMLQTSIAITVYVVAFLCSLAIGAAYGVGVPGSPDLDSHSDTGVFIFLATLCGFLLVVSVEVARACLKYIPAMTSRMFRVGFGLVALGCATASVSVTSKMIRQVLVLLSLEGSWWSGTLQGIWTACFNVAGVLISLGLFLPAVSRPVARFRVVERYRLLSLQRTWRRAAEMAPALVNAERSPLRGALSRNPRHRLHRAVVEILDSEMATGAVITGVLERRLVERAERILEA